MDGASRLKFSLKVLKSTFANDLKICKALKHNFSEVANSY